VNDWHDCGWNPFAGEHICEERATLRRSLVEAIGDEFAMCLTDERLAEVVAEWSA
jgi:hypothetical protein